MAARTRTSHLDGGPPADAGELAVLEHVQELALERRMQIPDLVEEDGAVIGRFELADLELVSSGESPALVTEELALQKLSRHGGAVHLDERARLAHTELVDGPCDQVLAGAGFAANEHGDVRARRLANDFSYLQHQRTCPEGKLVPKPATAVVLRFCPGRMSRASNGSLDGLFQYRSGVRGLLRTS